MKLKRQQGFTLIEVMVGMVIMVIAFVAALSILEMVSKGQRSNEESLAFTSARNQLVSIILDDTSWTRMVEPPSGAENPKFSCLWKQDSSVLADQDCFGAKDPLVIFNIKGAHYVVNGVTAYDFRQATQGFSTKGQPCNTFNGTPGSGDPLCPYQMVVTWEAVCSVAPCVNPPILFTGIAKYNSTSKQITPNLSNLGFQLIKTRIYCPPNAAPTGHVTGSVDIDVVQADRVKSNVNTDVLTKEWGMTNVVSAPCRRVLIGFTEDIDPVVAPSPNNTSSVFIRNEITGTNVVELRRVTTAADYSYQLYVDGALVVGSKPSWTKLTKASLFQLDVNNGLLRVCVNNRCPHYLARKIDFPFRVVFRPASQFYTPNGFKDITYTYVNL